nr:uncharacterized protein LOC9272246 isoform X5 [Oryza sativa Japonica Group]
MNKDPGAEEKFKEISAAYEMKKKDLCMTALEKQGSLEIMEVEILAPMGLIHMNSSMHSLVALISFLETAWVLGDSIMVQKSQTTGDLIFESIIGGKREVSIFRYETCGTCHGTGAKSSNDITECTQCRGQGRLMKTQRTPFGIVSQISTCLNCDGKGKVITENCTSCCGSGKIQVERNIRVDIPGGIHDGSAIRITRGGSVDNQRRATGDLYIFVHVNKKEGIHREGLDLFSDVTIDYTDAILGTTVKVETIEGFKDLYIPPGTQPGERLKFAQLGAPDIKNPTIRGDHNFVINVKIPKSISNQERTLVQEIAALKETGCISVPGEETKNRENLGERNSHSSTGKRRSLWRSIRNLFRGDDGDTRFASISAQSVTPLWTPRRGSHPAVLLLEGFLMITVLLFVISRTRIIRSTPKRYDRPTEAKEADGET